MLQHGQHFQLAMAFYTEAVRRATQHRYHSQYIKHNPTSFNVFYRMRALPLCGCEIIHRHLDTMNIIQHLTLNYTTYYTFRLYFISYPLKNVSAQRMDHLEANEGTVQLCVICYTQQATEYNMQALRCIFLGVPWTVEGLGMMLTLCYTVLMC